MARKYALSDLALPRLKKNCNELKVTPIINVNNYVLMLIIVYKIFSEIKFKNDKKIKKNSILFA